ncbi:phosphoadenosine phosphosulfate reductase family protein [Aquabacterium sp.]|uniref:phosphoadenosine phosphosulfate reductase family protein n=1 Tax=Aquabacterium sp. TaxID=1872578 RepID=UPI0040380EBF
MTVKILVPISGGKDSQACLKLALQQHPADQVRGLFCDTGFEHPDTYAHVEKLRTLYGPVRIDTVCAGDVLEKSKKYGRFPGGGARHCTDELKIQPTKRYCKALAQDQGSSIASKKRGIQGSEAGGFEVWYGMRSGESPEREARYIGKVCDEVYAPHEVLPSKYPKYLAALGVQFRLAVLDWSEQEVISFVGLHDLNPLYLAGFPRVGCFPCLASGDKWKEKAFGHDAFGAGQHAKVIQIGAQIGKSVWTSKGGKARNENNPVCELVCNT